MAFISTDTKPVARAEDLESLCSEGMFAKVSTRSQASVSIDTSSCCSQFPQKALWEEKWCTTSYVTSPPSTEPARDDPASFGFKWWRFTVRYGAFMRIMRLCSDVVRLACLTLSISNASLTSSMELLCTCSSTATSVRHRRQQTQYDRDRSRAVIAVHSRHLALCAGLCACRVPIRVVWGSGYQATPIPGHAAQPARGLSNYSVCMERNYQHHQDGFQIGQVGCPGRHSLVSLRRPLWPGSRQPLFFFF